MIDPSLLWTFAVAVIILMLIPGPNVALIVANSVAYGPRYGLLTVAGTSAAMVIQLALTALGMAKLLSGLGLWFEWIRWIGVAYLIFLGVTHWRAPVVDLTKVKPEPRAARKIFLRALIISLTNPKTLVFYGAFFPQFVVVDRPLGPQFGMLSALFLLIAIIVDGSWALAASRVRKMPSMHARLRNRLTGGMFIGAGAMLALARPK